MSRLPAVAFADVDPALPRPGNHLLRLCWAIVAAGLATAAVAAGCGWPGNGLRTVARDELGTGPIAHYRLIVATEESDLDQLRGALQDEPFSLADIDFAKELVVAVAGRMPNGRNPYIKRVTAGEDEARVELGGRGRSSFRGQSQDSTPFHAVALRRDKIAHPEALRWSAYFDGEELAGTARYGGRWLPTLMMARGGGRAYRTIAGGYMEEGAPARTTMLVASDATGLDALRRFGGRAAEAWRLDDADLANEVIVGVFQGPAGPAYGDRIFVADVQPIASVSINASWDDRDWQRNVTAEALEGPLDRVWASSYQIIAIPRSFVAGAAPPWVLHGPNGPMVEAARTAELSPTGARKAPGYQASIVAR